MVGRLLATRGISSGCERIRDLVLEGGEERWRI